MKKGLTLIETISVTVFAIALITFIVFQKTNLDSIARDETRKIAINAIYYSLEKDFYANNGYYPAIISEANLPTVSPELWEDPSGHKINTYDGTYFYQPGDCLENRCKKYILKAILEQESPYIKTNQEG